MSELTLMPGETVIDIEVVSHALPDQLADHRRLIEIMTESGTRPPVAALGTGDVEALSRFVVVFGRDSLLISDLLGDAALMDNTLTYLAARQGLRADAAPEPQFYSARHEEPGRIIHEERDPETDEIAQRLTIEEGWRWPIFTCDDATLLFVKHLSKRAMERSELLNTEIGQRDGITRTMEVCWLNSIAWILRRLDPQDGMLYSNRVVFEQPDGRQEISFYPTWQDSKDSAMRKDGSLATGPVAFAEIQGIAYDALVFSADLIDAENLDRCDANALRHAALKLRRSFVERALVSDRKSKFFAFGVEKRNDATEPLAVRKSNPGHLLDSQIFADADSRMYVETIVESLFDRRYGLVVNHGVRTLSVMEARFRAGGYHTGTVWVWEQAVMARGLASHGFNALAAWQENTVVATCEALNHYPEYVRGTETTPPTENTCVARVLSTDPELGRWTNTIIQPGQVVQGWTVAAYASTVDRVTNVRLNGPPTSQFAFEETLMTNLLSE